MEKKKIIFYYPDMYVGGVEMAMLNLAKRIYKDYDLYFFYRSFSDLNLAAEFRKYGILRNVADMYPDDECDTLVYCSLWTEREDRCGKIKAKQRILWTHAVIPPGGNKFYHLPTMRKIDRIVVVSEATRASIPFYLYCGRFDNKVDVINNILNVEEIKMKSDLYEPDDIQLAKDLNIITVARLSHEKGWLRMRYMCEALKKLNIDFKWFVVGEGYAPEQVHRIHLILDRIKEVKFLGKRLNPFPYVKQMDYLALLSDYESWGLAITEAKILGVPILAANFTSASEQVDNDKNGIIISQKDYSSYSAAASALLANKKLYKNALKDFDYNEINNKSEKRWREIFES